MSLNKINILAFLVVMLGTVGSARAAPASEKVFLVIHSYDPEMGITRHEDEGAVKAFEANKMADKGWRLERIYLDQKRLTEPKLSQMVSRANERVDALKPAAVLLTDDFAFKNFFRKMRNRGVPVAFSGINNDLSNYGYKPGESGVTGTMERYNYTPTLHLVKKLNPKISKIVVVSEADITGKALLSDFRNSIKNDQSFSKLGLSIDVYDGFEFEKLQEKLASVDPNTTAVFLMAFYRQRDRNGQHVSHKVIDQWIKEKTRFIDLGLSFFQMEDGRLMSLASSMRECGYFATNALFGALNSGKDPSQTPVREVMPLRLVLNHERARQLKISFPFEILTYAEQSDRLGGDTK